MNHGKTSPTRRRVKRPNAAAAATLIEPPDQVNVNTNVNTNSSNNSSNNFNDDYRYDYDDENPNGKGVKTYKSSNKHRRKIVQAKSIQGIASKVRYAWWKMARNLKRRRQHHHSNNNELPPYTLWIVGMMIGILIWGTSWSSKSLPSSSRMHHGVKRTLLSSERETLHFQADLLLKSFQHNPYATETDTDTDTDTDTEANIDTLTRPFLPKLEPLISSPNPDYGHLTLNFLGQNKHKNSLYQRQIRPDPMAHHGHPWNYTLDGDDFIETYYAFDDDFVRNTDFAYEDEKEEKEENYFKHHKHRHCRRNAWHRFYFPNCNTFHEIEILKPHTDVMGHSISLQKDINKDKEDKDKRDRDVDRMLGSGAFRTAFLQHQTFDPKLVVKVQKYKQKFKVSNYENIRMDALVMERLTASPRIVDVYGHCATSVYSEFLPNEVEELIVPGEGDGEDPPLHDKEDVDPKNNFTISEKLDLALQMAESIADLHGFADGVVVHDDIQLCQWLYTSDGRIKLNDFNRGEVMLFDEDSGEYCRYKNGGGGGEYRAPEEYQDSGLNEKIDVFSFGDNIYGLITGLWVFYHRDEEMSKKQKRIGDGEQAYLDPRYKGRNYIQDQLIELMYRCWEFDPDDRADIFEAVAFLRKLVKESKKRGIYDGMF